MFWRKALKEVGFLLFIFDLDIFAYFAAFNLASDHCFTLLFHGVSLHLYCRCAAGSPVKFYCPLPVFIHVCVAIFCVVQSVR